MSGVPDAAIAACPDYEAETCRTALRQVLAPFGGLAWVKPGMRIAVKANLVSAMKPERAATTHPMLLRVLTEELVRRGASVVVGDSPGGTYAAGHLNAVYRACGLAAVEEAGGTLNRNFAQREADLPDARVAKHITYTAYLDDADAVISFCKLKSHGMLALSAATKNLFGAIPGTIKPEYHYRYPDPMDFAGMLIDLNEYFRPRLYLVDAVVAMEGNGPTAGTPRPFGALLAGTNPHRIDLLCALTHRAEAGECADAARSGRARPDAARPGAALCCGGCRGLCLPGFPDRPAWDRDGFRRAGRHLWPPAREDGGACAADAAGPEAGAVRRLRRVPRCLSGPCHYDRKRPGAHRPRALHPLLLLSGILPEGRDAGAPHRDRPHRRTLVTAGESLERIRNFLLGIPTPLRFSE